MELGSLKGYHFMKFQEMRVCQDLRFLRYIVNRSTLLYFNS